MPWARSDQTVPDSGLPNDLESFPVFEARICFLTFEICLTPLKIHVSRRGWALLLLLLNRAITAPVLKTATRLNCSQWSFQLARFKFPAIRRVIQGSAINMALIFDARRGMALNLIRWAVGTFWWNVSVMSFQFFNSFVIRPKRRITDGLSVAVLPRYLQIKSQNAKRYSLTKSGIVTPIISFGGHAKDKSR